MSVELMWSGKYDTQGSKIAPLRVALPFQTVETVNESAQQRQRSLELFAGGRESDWRNRLIWGDKKYVLPSLLPEFAGKVDLVYVDPPFFTGDDFSLKVEVEGEEFTKQPSMIELKAYRDTWGRGIDSYLEWLYPAALLLRELLSESGSIFLHLDWHVGHYGKILMDEVFGYENLRNEVIWAYTGPGSPNQQQFGRKHDTILWYSKSSSNWAFYPDAIRVPHDPKTLANFKAGLSGSGFVAETYDLDEGGKIPEDWWPMAIAGRYPIDGVRRMGYPTEKPWPLLERIVRACTKEDDLVLDCFGGSGLTAGVAETLGRRWVVADLSRFAIHMTRKRLLSTEGIRPFVVQNLGKYERQHWQSAEFGQDADDRVAAYRTFMLSLYGAQPLAGNAWLHGLKQKRLVHVGSVDAPVTVGDVRLLAAEYRTLTNDLASPIAGVDLLGWDFAFELNEVAKQEAALANLDIRLVRIPREVLDKRAIEQGDIQFFELAALAVAVDSSGREVNVKITNFIIPPDDVPEEIRREVKTWEQWIDYWAIDWDNRGDAFHNEWQAYRSKPIPQLVTSASHTYESTGDYVVSIKVIDILGNDTTKTVPVTVT